MLQNRKAGTAFKNIPPDDGSPSLPAALSNSMNAVRERGGTAGKAEIHGYKFGGHVVKCFAAREKT